MFNIVVLASGNGTNFKAIIEACQSGIIPAQIKLLICNKKNAGCLQLSEQFGIPNYYKPLFKNDNREDYYNEILKVINELDDIINIIVLAGWMLLVTPKFISDINNTRCGLTNIINLHPALPGQFPGTNAIERAWDSYQKKEICQSGLMVHHVIPEVDAGEVISKHVIPIFKNETFETFKKRLQYFEKPTLINAINILLNSQKPLVFNDSNLILTNKGKVRDCYTINYNGVNLPYLVINHSDRLSAYDHHICNITGKGNILLMQNIWWMIQTKHIIPNHCICWSNGVLLSKKCKPIPLEIVVRGYITGSTKTSLWTNYNNGCRNYCGIELPDGLIKNQKLEYPIITPTTKGEIDVPITPDEIIKQNILTKEQWGYIVIKALELYNFGVKKAEENRFILVDTKYEFGFDENNKIILIDEMHTSDSSRYWLSNSYYTNMKKGVEPDKLDKDCIRDWLINNSNPRDTEFIPPPIPIEIKDKVHNAYKHLLSKLSNQKVNLWEYQSKQYLLSCINNWYYKKYIIC